jgi:Glycosyltransferase
VLISTLKELNVFFSFTRIVSGKKISHFVREADTLDRIFVQGGLENKILLKAMQLFYPKSSGVIANCDITKSDLIKNINKIRNKTTVIYNPLDLGLIQNLSIESFKNSVTYPTIIACGRLTMKKNFADLIRVSVILKEKYPNIKVNILGEGEDESYLKSLVKELQLEGVVNFFGFVGNPYKYYSESHVFVQTSLWEGFGYVLAEAMACGTPVVAYDSKGAMREILADGKYGMLTPVGDLQALADAIVQQIEQPTSLELLNESVQRFDVDTIARQYLDAMGVK